MRTALALALAALCTACKPEAPPPPAGAGLEVKEIAVTDHGYEPARLEVAGGQPLTLRFTRRSSDSCGETLLVDGDPVTHVLPKDVAVDVRVTPPKSGTLAFGCGMHMLRGVLVTR